MEQLRGRTEQELVEMMVYMSSQMGNQQGGGQMAAAQGGRVGLRTGGDNSLFLEESSEVIRGGQDGDSVVDETENIEVAGMDTPSEDLENLQELRDSFFEVHGREPVSMDELKMFIRIQRQETNQGGRVGLRSGGPDWFTIRVDELMANGMSEEAAASQAYDEGPGGQDTFAQGGITRTGYAMGTEHPVIPSKDGKQLDMRDTGGYQPHGAKEKHDDVRALLAQGEFVMTSDAVKGLGGGDREAGAKKMYDVMHNLEAMA